MGRDRGSSINRSRLAQKYPMQLVTAILAAFANSIGLSNDLLYVIDGQDTIERENNLELNLLLAEERLSGLCPGDDDDVLGLSCVCPDDPPEPGLLQDILMAEESEAPEAHEEVPEPAARENFPGSHPLSLEALPMKD
eukprot:s916_g10.t1